MSVKTIMPTKGISADTAVSVLIGFLDKKKMPHPGEDEAHGKSFVRYESQRIGEKRLSLSKL